MIPPEELRVICHTRLARWAERLIAQHMTPIVLIGVSHDPTNGRVCVLTLENVDDNALEILLAGAAVELRGSRQTRVERP